MLRLAIKASAVSVLLFAPAAIAQQPSKPLSNEEISKLLEQISKRAQTKPLPLCGGGGSFETCRLFAVPTPPSATSPFTSQKFELPSFKPAEQAAQPSPPVAPAAHSPVTVACPKDDHFHSCNVVSSLTELGPGQVGATLSLGGSRSADLSRRASEGLLTSSELKGLLSEKTIGLLPEAVETSAADRAVGVLARSGIAKAGRGAAVVGVALMTYAAYEYFFGTDKKPDDPKAPKK